jgi:hypothetical protein
VGDWVENRISGKGIYSKIQYNIIKIGWMAGNMKGNGLIIICMVKGFIHGKMEENMKVIINMIR